MPITNLNVELQFDNIKFPLSWVCFSSVYILKGWIYIEQHKILVCIAKSGKVCASVLWIARTGISWYMSLPKFLWSLSWYWLCLYCMIEAGENFVGKKGSRTRLTLGIGQQEDFLVPEFCGFSSDPFIALLLAFASWADILTSFIWASKSFLAMTLKNPRFEKRYIWTKRNLLKIDWPRIAPKKYLISHWGPGQVLTFHILYVPWAFCLTSDFIRALLITSFEIT